MSGNAGDLGASSRSLVELPVIPWQWSGDACLLQVSGFPIPEQELVRVRHVLESLITALSRRGLSSEVFMQLFQFTGGTDRLQKYSRGWMPDLGLGVWPDRPSPTLWTKEDFADLGPGESPRPLMYQVLRITTAPAVRAMARQSMLDLGSVIQIMIPGSDTAFLERSKNLFRASIEQASFRNFTLYIPLLECQSLQTATAAQLDRWFCGASVYIRESFEDKGIVIASREPLAPVFEELGGRFNSGSEPAWQIPMARGD